MLECPIKSLAAPVIELDPWVCAVVLSNGLSAAWGGGVSHHPAPTPSFLNPIQSSQQKSCSTAHLNGVPAAEDGDSSCPGE